MYYYICVSRNKCKEPSKIGRQRNMTEMKEQEKSPEKELKEMEANNLPDAEFKQMTLKSCKEFMRT